MAARDLDIDLKTPDPYTDADLDEGVGILVHRLLGRPRSHPLNDICTGALTPRLLSLLEQRLKYVLRFFGFEDYAEVQGAALGEHRPLVELDFTQVEGADRVRALLTPHVRGVLQRLRVPYTTVTVRRQEAHLDTDKQPHFGAVKRWFDTYWSGVDVSVRTPLVEGISTLLSVFETTPDITGGRERLTVHLEAEILLKLHASARMCQSTPDSLVRAALVRLFEANKHDFDAWLAANPGALDNRPVVGVASASTRKPAAALRTTKSKARPRARRRPKP
jgi:hypothetical protein